MVSYKIIESNEKTELLNFFKQADTLFPIPLSHKQELEKLSEKLLTSGRVIGAYHDDELVGAVCGYLNDMEQKRAYISVLCVQPDFQGKSIARNLVELFLDECRKAGMSSVFLYTHQTNTAARKLYTRIGFVEETDKNRPQDYLYTFWL